MKTICTCMIVCALSAPLFAASETVNGITWQYSITNGEATIESGRTNTSAVPTDISGQIIIPETLGGAPVTLIGDGAFQGCSSLTEVVIPEGVTTIGWYAFYGCSSLTEVVIPEGVTSIGYKTFYDCSSLTEVVIPENVTTIDGHAFYGCSALTEVVIPENVTTIGGHAFYGCSALTSVVIPEGVTSIGSQAFYGCSSLTEMVIPEGVTEIGKGVFYGCSSLTEVVIPEGVTSIGDKTFYDCSSLTKVVIPESVTEIGEWAFENCSSLTEVVIPESVTSIGARAFYGCSSLTEMVIPEGVTEIGKGVFSGCSSLESVVIPKGVMSIGDYAFNVCSSLTSVIIPESVTSIGAFAFQGCSALTEVIIPESVTEIDGYAFSHCSSLTSVVIPEGVTEIDDYVFSRCSSLTSVVIPASVTSIGHNAFSGCPVETVVFRGDVPDGVSASGFPLWLSAFPQEYGAAWELALSEFRVRYTVMDVLVPGQVQVEARAETPTTKTIKVTYTVRSELPSVKVRAVAWKDGVRSFANIVPVRTGEGVPRGESVTTNEEHTFVWEVASDWATDLDKVAVEILVQEGTLLPQELITIPATKSHKAMTITRNALADSWLFDALVWCYAEGDTQLVVNNGRVSVNGTDIAKDDKLPTGTNWDGSYNSGWKREATALLNYLYGKMGYKVLAGEDLEYAETATRLDFADWNGDYPHRQVSVKIEEGE